MSMGIDDRTFCSWYSVIDQNNQYYTRIHQTELDIILLSSAYNLETSKHLKVNKGAGHMLTHLNRIAENPTADNR